MEPLDISAQIVTVADQLIQKQGGKAKNEWRKAQQFHATLADIIQQPFQGETTTDSIILNSALLVEKVRATKRALGNDLQYLQVRLSNSTHSHNQFVPVEKAMDLHLPTWTQAPRELVENLNPPYSLNYQPQGSGEALAYDLYLSLGKRIERMQKQDQPGPLMSEEEFAFFTRFIEQQSENENHQGYLAIKGTFGIFTEAMQPGVRSFDDEAYRVPMRNMSGEGIRIKYAFSAIASHLVVALGSPEHPSHARALEFYKSMSQYDDFHNQQHWATAFATTLANCESRTHSCDLVDYVRKVSDLSFVTEDPAYEQMAALWIKLLEGNFDIRFFHLSEIEDKAEVESVPFDVKDFLTMVSFINSAKPERIRFNLGNLNRTSYPFGEQLPLIDISVDLDPEDFIATVAVYFSVGASVQDPGLTPRSSMAGIQEAIEKKFSFIIDYGDEDDVTITAHTVDADTIEGDLGAAFLYTTGLALKMKVGEIALELSEKLKQNGKPKQPQPQVLNPRKRKNQPHLRSHIPTVQENLRKKREEINYRPTLDIDLTQVGDPKAKRKIQRYQSNGGGTWYVTRDSNGNRFFSLRVGRTHRIIGYIDEASNSIPSIDLHWRRDL